MLKGLFGIGDGCIDVGRIPFCNAGNQITIRWIEVVEIRARAGLVLFAAYPQFAGIHLLLSTSVLVFLKV